HAERVEMVLADPGRMHAELVGIERFRRDIGDELVGGAGIVVVVIVAQREVAEFHDALPVICRTIQRRERVGWAKPRSGVPTRTGARVGTARSAPLPTLRASVSASAFP